MNNAVEGSPTERARHLLYLAEHELGIVGHGITMSRGEVVDHCDLVAGLEEPGGYDAADIAGTACDEHLHLDGTGPGRCRTSARPAVGFLKGRALARSCRSALPARGGY